MSRKISLASSGRLEDSHRLRAVASRLLQPEWLMKIRNMRLRVQGAEQPSLACRICSRELTHILVLAAAAATSRAALLSPAESRAHGLIRGQRQNQIQHSESLPTGTDNYTVEPAGPTV
jgi:hypothetical protein